MQVYTLHARKLDREENLLDFYVESIAVEIRMLSNVTSIK